MSAAEREAESVAAADEDWEPLSGRQLVGALIYWLAALLEIGGVLWVAGWIGS